MTTEKAVVVFSRLKSIDRLVSHNKRSKTVPVEDCVSETSAKGQGALLPTYVSASTTWRESESLCASGQTMSNRE